MDSPETPFTTEHAAAYRGLFEARCAGVASTQAAKLRPIFGYFAAMPDQEVYVDALSAVVGQTVERAGRYNDDWRAEVSRRKTEVTHVLVEWGLLQRIGSEHRTRFVFPPRPLRDVQSIRGEVAAIQAERVVAEEEARLEPVISFEYAPATTDVELEPLIVQLLREYPDTLIKRSLIAELVASEGLAVSKREEIIRRALRSLQQRGEVSLVNAARNGRLYRLGPRLRQAQPNLPDTES